MSKRTFAEILKIGQPIFQHIIMHIDTPQDYLELILTSKRVKKLAEHHYSKLIDKWVSMYESIYNNSKFNRRLTGKGFMKKNGYILFHGVAASRCVCRCVNFSCNFKYGKLHGGSVNYDHESRLVKHRHYYNDNLLREYIVRRPDWDRNNNTLERVIIDPNTSNVTSKKIDLEQDVNANDLCANYDHIKWKYSENCQLCGHLDKFFTD